MMDTVIADVYPTYGMLFSRHLGTSGDGNIQFDLSGLSILVRLNNIMDYSTMIS